VRSLHWGADPREIGWTFWRAGQNSDESMATAIQPDRSLPIYICGESFSRSQSWVEGALETSELAVAQILV
jgi:monoamine oxidase